MTGPKPRLHVITPVYRPVLLSMVAESLRLLDEHFEYTWHLDLSEAWPPPLEGGSGSGLASACRKRNRLLEEVPTCGGGWLYFLDDDNLIHPDMPRVTAGIIREGRCNVILIQRQLHRDGSTRTICTPPAPHPARIDMGQFMATREVIGDLRFDSNGVPDGNFIERLCHKPEAIVERAETACFYNALRFRNPVHHGEHGGHGDHGGK